MLQAHSQGCFVQKLPKKPWERGWTDVSKRVDRLLHFVTEFKKKKLLSQVIFCFRGGKNSLKTTTIFRLLKKMYYKINNKFFFLFKHGYFNRKTGVHKAVSQTKFEQAIRLFKRLCYITLENIPRLKCEQARIKFVLKFT